MTTFTNRQLIVENGKRLKCERSTPEAGPAGCGKRPAGCEELNLLLEFEPAPVFNRVDEILLGLLLVEIELDGGEGGR